MVDGMTRLYVWRNSSSPLVVQVGKRLDTILNLWRTEAIRIGAIMMALILFVLATTLFLAREIGRRAEAEERLEELATTDALTGLRNRRKFDAEIDLEWRRAARNGTPVALLMIDADHFKSYNDTWGHQAGDQVLVGIAICVSDSVRRAGDCPARFGGEEFAVLLPGLSDIEAFRLAETIRQKVEQWSEDPVSTVSIGVASMIPVPTLDWSDLIEAADKALYAAKANGRNQSVLASLPKLALVAKFPAVIPGRCEASNPEARTSGSGPSDHPGMTGKARAPFQSLLQILLHLRAQAVAQIGARHAVGDIGAQEAGLRAAIVPLAFELDAVEFLRLRQPDHGVGELDLAAGAALLGLENLEDFRLQDVAPGDREVGRRGALRRLLHHAVDLEHVAGGALADAADAVLMGEMVGHALRPRADWISRRACSPPRSSA